MVNKPLERNIERFKKFSPEAPAVIREDCTDSFEFLNTAEMVAANEKN